MTENNEDPPGGHPKMIPKLADLLEWLARRSRGLQATRDVPEEGRDLVREVESRGDYECDDDEAAWLSNPAIWPADTTEKLLLLVELCESLAIPYDLAYTHRREQAPTTIGSITIHMTGD